VKTVLYLRVSTASQGRSGLGLEAQRHAVEAFCHRRDCKVLAEFTEVESGKRNERPELLRALHHAKVTGATLVVAKMDRLSRNLAFLAALQDSGARFVAADMPEANELTVHIMASVAQAEGKAISTRTKEALQAAKARGCKADGTPFKAGRLGNPNGAAALKRAGRGNGAAVAALKAAANDHATNLATTIAHLKAQGLTSLRQLAEALNARDILTPRGGKWHPTSVKNLLARIGAVG
jgi:DNA invertase Pin-like site-specific DNA recombinase